MTSEKDEAYMTPTLEKDAMRPAADVTDKSASIDDAERHPQQLEEPKLTIATWMTLMACCFIWIGINYGVSSLGFWLTPALKQIGGTVPGVGLWWAEGFLVVQVALTPIFGLMSDFSPIVRKYTTIGLCLLGGTGLFIAGSAHHLQPQGIVGVCLYGMSLIAYGPAAAIVADVFPRRMRGVAQGIMYGVGIGVSGFIADVAGGAMVKRSPANGWRWNIFVGGAAEFLGCALLFIFYKPAPVVATDHVELPSLAKRFKALDWVGSFFFLCAIVPIMMALIWGNSSYPWSSPHCIGTIVVGCFFVVVFGLHQIFIKKDGFLNHKLFRNRNFVISILAIFVEGITYITLNTYLAIQVGTLYTSDPVLLGLHFGIILACSSVTCIAWGYYSKRTRDVKIPLVIGFLGFTAAAAGFSQLRPFKNSNAMAAYGLCALVGASFGGPQGLILTATQLSVSRDLTGLATSVNMAARSFGGALGAAIANVIFGAKITKILPATIAEYAIGAGVAPNDVTKLVMAVATTGPATTSVPGFTADQVQAAIRGWFEGYAMSFSYIYYFIIPWTAVTALILLVLRPMSEEMSWSIDRPVEAELHNKTVVIE